jgi:CelD/BcsL family acetyltransferase involved in cellulose biosynthesis
MAILRVDPRTDPHWQRLIDEQASSVFHTPDWFRAINDTYGFEPQAYIIVDDAGVPQAGVSFCQISDIRGTRLNTRTFSDHCDPLASNATLWQQLSDQLATHNCPVTLRPLHNLVPLSDPRFALVKKAKWHGLDLSANLDTIWKTISSSARRAVNKARANAIEVRIAESKSDLRAFFELHLRVRKYKYHLIAQPYRFFEAIWDRFIARQKGMLALSIKESEIVGGVLFLQWKNVLYYKFNASNPDFLAIRPNDLVIWHGIQYAKSNGLTALDFGLSDWDQEGLIRYKRKYATTEQDIYFLEHTPSSGVNGNGRIEQQIGELLGQMTELFTDSDVSDEITEKAGDTLYRFFA